MRRHRAILTTQVDSDERRTHPPPFLINGATRRTLSISQGCAHLVVREVGRRPTASTSRNRHLIMSPTMGGGGGYINVVFRLSGDASARTPSTARTRRGLRVVRVRVRGRWG